MCTGRMDPAVMADAFSLGLDGLLVLGCLFGECHYISGNLVARRRFAILNELLDFFGIDPGRVNFMWASAAEGERFAVLVEKATKRIKALGPNKKFERSWC